MLGWWRLGLELGRWRRAGRRPVLWWRDDDARSVTPPFRRLLVHLTRADVPLCLAVIPEGLDPELCTAVAPYARIAVLQHGVDHANAGGSPPSQFSPDEDPKDVAVRLAEGWAWLQGFRRRLPVYAPPWNTLTPNVTAAVPLAGLRAISGWNGPSQPGRVDAHLDLMRWRGGPRFAGRERLLDRLRDLLQRRRRRGQWNEPIGLLTHHLVHDEAAWRFLDELLLYPPLQDLALWPEPSALFGLTTRIPEPVAGPAVPAGAYRSGGA
jgi:hypothetical protein